MISMYIARLMARFSSVAYEDPPMSTLQGKNASQGIDDVSTTPNMNRVERFIDDFGVTITRPTKQHREVELASPLNEKDKNGQTDSDSWENVTCRCIFSTSSPSNAIRM